MVRSTTLRSSRMFPGHGVILHQIGCRRCEANEVLFQFGIEMCQNAESQRHDVFFALA